MSTNFQETAPRRYSESEPERLIDPATKRLVLIAAGLAGGVTLLVGGWSMLDRHTGPVPVIQAESGPVRVKPADPGGMKVLGANNAIMAADLDQSASADTLAPPPETPQPQALRAQIAAARAAAHPAVPAAPRAAPQAAAPAAPTTTPASTPSNAAPPAAATMAASAPAPAPAPTPAPAAASGADQAPPAGHAMVQLAALRSEAAAKVEWQRLQRRMPDLLADRHPVVERVEEHDGRVFWRLRTGGFADRSAARAFCTQVHAKGGGCTIAAF